MDFALPFSTSLASSFSHSLLFSLFRACSPLLFFSLSFLLIFCPLFLFLYLLRKLFRSHSFFSLLLPRLLSLHLAFSFFIFLFVRQATFSSVSLLARILVSSHLFLVYYSFGISILSIHLKSPSRLTTLPQFKSLHCRIREFNRILNSFSFQTPFSNRTISTKLFLQQFFSDWYFRSIFFYHLKQIIFNL